MKGVRTILERCSILESIYWKDYVEFSAQWKVLQWFWKGVLSWKMLEGLYGKRERCYIYNGLECFLSGKFLERLG